MRESENPYLPPKAAIADPIEAPPTEAPAPVNTAMRLLMISFVLIFVEVALDWVALTAVSPPIVLVFWLVLASILQLWIYAKIASGRNWARITWLVIFAVSLPFTLIVLPELAQRAPVVAGVTFVAQVLTAFGLYLLFFPGRAWFRRRPPQRR
jgi:hypothetical protein